MHYLHSVPVTWEGKNAWQLLLVLIYMIKIMIALHLSLLLRPQCHMCLSALWSQLSYWALEYLLNYFNYCQVKNEAYVFFSTSFFFPPPLQDSLNGLPDFALSSLLCLGLAVLTLWVLAYALHSVSWNSGDHLARRLRTIFGSVTAKIEIAVSIIEHCVSREWVDCRTSLHYIYLPLCVLCLCFFYVLNYFSKVA